MTTADIVEVWNGPGRSDGELTPVEPRHNGLHASLSKLAFEHWYFDAHLDTGHIVIGFLTKRRPEDLPLARPWVEMIVYAPDGTRRQVSRRYPQSAASFATETCDVRVGNNTARTEFRDDGLPTHHLRMAEDGLVFDPLMLAHHTDIVLSTGETSLTEGPARFDATAGRAYPEWIELRVPDKLELRLAVERVIHAHDLLDDLPVVRSRLVKPLVHRLVGHPGYFRFESAFELTVHTDSGVERRGGTTLHELVALT
ncbi:hypothetical protein [Nocardia sp. SSK8]|uniref:hypothetical protein n=1 Tax=Nocardia sp. SSK8 TaxID=3120154 RepID=UPI003008B8DF